MVDLIVRGARVLRREGILAGIVKGKVAATSGGAFA